MFRQYKIYFILIVIVSVAVGSWSARGWYEDGKVVTALEKQKAEYEKQAEKDAAALTHALEKEEKVRIVYRSIQNEANKTDLCSNGGNDFLRLFNRGATAANTTR